MDNFQRNQIIIPSIITIFLLFYGIPEGTSYGFYVLLRWVVSVVAIYLAFTTYEIEQKGWCVAFILTALLFNPIIPFYLDKSTWVTIDVLAIGIFGLASLLIKKEKEK